MNGGKIDKNIEVRLLSGRSVSVLTALNEIKTKGNIVYLPLLFNLLNSSPDAQIEKEILHILGTLKIQEAASVMAGALQNSDYLQIRKKLTAACWQNGLDFKNYLPVFIELIIREDWETGFEALTVIENMEIYPEKEITEKSITMIHEAMPEVTDKKRYFLQEVLTLIC